MKSGELTPHPIPWVGCLPSRRCGVQPPLERKLVSIMLKSNAMLVAHGAFQGRITSVAEKRQEALGSDAIHQPVLEEGGGLQSLPRDSCVCWRPRLMGDGAGLVLAIGAVFGGTEEMGIWRCEAHSCVLFRWINCPSDGQLLGTDQTLCRSRSGHAIGSHPGSRYL